MSGWTEASLGDVCELYQPKTISSWELVEDGPFPVYGANGVIGKYDKFNHEESQLLITCRGATCGAVNISQPKSWINGNAMVVKPRNKSIDVGFLKHLFLGSIDLSAVITGAAQPQITRQSLAPLKIRFPNPAEQQRLISILDQADALRAKRREALARMDSLTLAIFIEMFGEPVANPMKWPDVQLKDILSMPLRNGLSPSNSGGVFANVLTLSAITGYEFDSNALKKSTFNSTPPQHQSVNENDFLICRGNGNVRLVGKGYFPSSSMEDVTFPDTMIAARVTPKLIEREYLQNLWHTDAVRRQIEASARTTNGTFKVNQTMLEELSFMLPPMPRQRDFASRIQSVKALKAAHKAALQELDRLFASLQHRAFQGEL